MKKQTLTDVHAALASAQRALTAADGAHTMARTAWEKQLTLAERLEHTRDIAYYCRQAINSLEEAAGAADKLGDA